MMSNPGNPCIVAPTGSGKSHIIAGLCEDVIRRWSASRIVILAHVKELLVQNAEKLLHAWPEAPLGIYSAGLRQKDINAITVAGIQSIWRKAHNVGKIDIAIIDEAHLINNESSGMYRSFLKELMEINPYLRVIGLTATPYRLGQGMVTEGKRRLFDALVESISIVDLVDQGYLANLRSKFTDLKLDVDGVRKRCGDFVESELQAHVNTGDNNSKIVAETKARADGRNAWLFFCTGVEHAFNMRDELIRQDIIAETVTGETSADDRARILQEFKSGRIKALTNVNVLTTGFDYPDIDLIVMARPTLSPGLYLQMAGRGMRVKSEGRPQDCLVLDFAGNIAYHGPITDVTPPSAKKGQDKKVPVKECPACQEAVPISKTICPCCGYEFPPALTGSEKSNELDQNNDIMGGPIRMEVRSWKWHVVNSKKNGTPMIRVDFHGLSLLAPTVSLYLCLLHGGYAAGKARRMLFALIGGSCLNIGEEDLADIVKIMNMGHISPPDWVEYRRDGRFYDVRRWG